MRIKETEGHYVYNYLQDNTQEQVSKRHKRIVNDPSSSATAKCMNGLSHLRTSAIKGRENIRSERANAGPRNQNSSIRTLLTLQNRRIGFPCKAHLLAAFLVFNMSTAV